MDKVISFSGVERGEFVYYIAAMISKSGKAVMVIDNSFSNDIYGAVSDFTECGTVTKQNIAYVKNACFDKEYVEEFDYVLIWQGMNINMDVILQCDESYLLPNYTPSCMNACKKLFEDKDLITAIFMRDSVMSNKITEKSVAGFLEIPEEKIMGIMTHDSKDYEAYLSFLYNGRHKFKSLTPGYNDCLKTAITLILGEEEKKTSKLFRKTRSAKTF